MQIELTPLNGQKAIGITFTDKPVTAFGSLALFAAFAQRVAPVERLAAALLEEAILLALGAPARRTLATLRITVFACGAILGRARRQAVLRLSRAKPWQQWFPDHLHRLLMWSPNCNAAALGEANP